jgi:hypothetical protein
LVAGAFEKFKHVDSKNELHQLIQQELAQHGLKEKHIRDILQEMDCVEAPMAESDEFKRFKEKLDAGHTYRYAVLATAPSRHFEKKLKHWFVHEYGGSDLETKNTRRVDRQHCYLSLKDELVLSELDDLRKADIWTAIGFIFADGAVTKNSLQLVITEDDGYYLAEHVLPTLLDERFSDNAGPVLITAHSINHDTSFSGSNPVARLHIEDSLMASFVQELGMPANKTAKGLDIGPRIRDLDNRYFYCFLCGLFDGDGSITHGTPDQFSLHLDFDLHSEAICESLKHEIERRSNIPMRVNSHNTKAGKRHYKLSASTTPRALSLLAHMYWHSNFQLRRKVARADELVCELKRTVQSYKNMEISFATLADGTATLEQFNELLCFLRKRMNE